MVRASGEAAAAAVSRSWSDGDAVMVVDPGLAGPALGAVLDAAQVGGPVDGEVAAVVFTSGTSGGPKAVELTWEGMVHSARAVSAALDVDPGRDRWYCGLALHHVAGLAVLARATVTGTPITFDLDDPATLTALVPTQLVRARGAGARPDRYRRILVGGGALPPGLILPANATTTYGMTETWGGVVHDGRALPGAEVRAGRSGQAVGPILVRTPALMARYRGDPEATARAVDADGWFTTGDVGRIDPDGGLVVVGRDDDVIVTGGVKVWPAEVEAALAAHPAVAEVAVSGVADATWGGRVVAWVVPVPGRSAPALDELRDFARDRLAPAQLPREVVEVAALPRGRSGKLLRRRLASGR